MVVLWFWDGHKDGGNECSIIVFLGLLVVVWCLWGEIVTRGRGWAPYVCSDLVCSWPSYGFGDEHKRGAHPYDRMKEVDVYKTTTRVKDTISRS